MKKGLIELGWFGELPECEHDWREHVRSTDSSQLNYFKECEKCGEVKESHLR